MLDVADNYIPRYLAIMLLIGMMLLVSCPSGKQTGSTGGNTTGTIGNDPVEYPPDWPIPELVAPPNSTASYLPPAFYPEDVYGKVRFVSGEIHGGGYNWVLAFSTSMTWDQAVAYLDSIVQPLGYQMHEQREPKRNALSRSTHALIRYKSTDSELTIEMSYMKTSKNVIHEAHECYELSISK
jgi:hypothetical protein